MLRRMKFTRCRTWVSMLAVISLTGCDFFTPEPADPLLRKRAIAIREAPPELVFDGKLAGQPIFLIVHDCEVFSVTRAPDQEAAEWTSLVKPEFYPFFTACVRESLSFDGRVMTAVLGRQAIGAGGCCASGGTYRSVDGRVWKKD